MYSILLNQSLRLAREASKLRISCSPVRWISSEPCNHKEGDIIHGYKLEKVDYIPELNIKPFYFRHETTGAEHLHLQKEGDSNNVFAVSLRTTPKNSTGVAHILEHMTLSGSKKYDVQDPFFQMLTRSLATFMNAMTGPDFTAYPFATQNAKDFENLLRVYVDAVFFPRLRSTKFRQEGWRLEHEKPDIKETPIVIRGVVYNEMKGAFSSSSQLYCRLLLNNLFPDTTYRYESGGDPEVIPDLSHAELKKFYETHYHPSNSKFFTYGDLPVSRHLELLNQLVMSKFSENTQAREQSVVKEQEPWTVPKTVEITCPVDPMNPSPDKQTTTSLTYMLPTTNTNFEDTFALRILSTLLIDGPNAPFYKNLIESGIGSDYSPSTGIDLYTKQPYFSVGLQNIKQEDIPKVQEIIQRTFVDAANEGFPQERVDAILHDVELGLKHISGNFGLRLLMSMESVYNHDGDVIDYLKVNKYMEKFKQALASDKQFWRNLINRYFLANKHRLILNMSPDPNYEDKRKEREKSLLEGKVASLSDVDREAILYEGMELMKIQESRGDPSVLPCLEPSKDISKELRYKNELKFDSMKGLKVQICEQPTNEVVYFRALADIEQKLKSSDLVDYLPLFCDVATKLGAGKYNRHQFSLQSQLKTGGLNLSLLLTPSLSEFDVFRKELFLGSHCLRRNVDSMFELWSHVFKQIHFQENKEYLNQLVKVSATELSEGISHMGSLYAIKKSSEKLSTLSALDERLSGLTYVVKMKNIASKESIDSITSKLQSIASLVLDPFNMRCSINAEAESIGPTSEALERFIGEAQKDYGTKGSVDTKSVEDSSALTEIGDIKFPFATHYVAKSLVTVPRNHKDFAKLVILSKLISSKYLLREVREKGGAYGAKAILSNSGIFSFSSYRDPNTTKTLDTFNRASRWVVEGKGYNDQDIEESKLGIFQDVDRPVEPGKRGLNYFIFGETDEARQQYRKRLLEVTRKDVVSVASKYLQQEKAGTHII